MKDEPSGMTFGVSGHYMLEAHKINKAGEIISSRIAADWFDNVITDQGLDYLSGTAGNYFFRGMAVGSGNAAEATTDTALKVPVAATITVQSSSQTAQVATLPYYVSIFKTCRFAAGAATGNLSEVGVLGGTSGTLASGPCSSRALIKDINGNPVTITIESDEILDVTYELRIYPTMSASGSFNIAVNGTPTSYAYTITPGNMGQVTGGNPAYWNCSSAIASGSGWKVDTGWPALYTGAIGTPTTSPAGTSKPVTSGGVSTAAYVQGNHYNDCTLTWGLNDGNQTSQSLGLQLAGGGYFQVSFSPAITKTSSQSLSLTFRISWGRYAP